jgi:ubiquitin-protein ligase
MTEFIDSNSLLALNNVSSSVVRKRISAELKTLINTYTHIHITSNNELESIVLHIHDNNITSQYNEFSFIIPNTYPFQPPKVKLNEDDYINLLKINSYNKSKIIQKLTSKCCLCCNTIICKDNWSPALTFIDIITEIKHHLKIIDKILLQLSFDKFKLLLCDDYKNMETMRNMNKII